MEKKNWEVVLETMYENERYRVREQDEYLEKDTELDESEIKESLVYMENAGLMEPKSRASNITPKGFDIIHERKQREERIEHDREMNEQQDQTNRAIAFLTIGLVLVTSVDTVVRAFVGWKRSNWAVIFAMISVIIAAVLVREINNADMIFQE